VDECKPLLRGAGGPLGGAVQVDPIKPKLKPPGAKRLKLECDEPLSKLGFKFNLRRYSWDSRMDTSSAAAGIEAGRCRLTLSNPLWKRLERST